MGLLKLALVWLVVVPLSAQARLDRFEDTREFLAWQQDNDRKDQEAAIFSHVFKLRNAHGDVRILASKNPHVLLKPASTMKIFTGWWAFQENIRDPEYLGEMLKTSSNSMAQSTLDLLGTARDMELYYANLGLDVNEESLRVADGSGLSYDNKSTCAVQIELLEMIYDSADYETFRDLLAQPGERGTLENRLPSLAGKVFAKTGTLNYTAALSGYIEAPEGTIIFCVMSDYLNHSLTRERARIDAMVIENYNRAL